MRACVRACARAHARWPHGGITSPTDENIYIYIYIYMIAILARINACNVLSNSLGATHSMVSGMA